MHHMTFWTLVDVIRPHTLIIHWLLRLTLSEAPDIRLGAVLILLAVPHAPIWDVSAKHHIERKKPMPYLKCWTTAMPISPSRDMIANARPYLERSTMTRSPQRAMRVATIAK
jgi:hypothetical protein